MLIELRLFEITTFDLGHSTSMNVNIFFFAGNVNEIYEILTEGEETDFDDLPDSMKRIRQIVDNCQKEALDVVNDFDKVLEAMNELQEATLNKKGESEGIKRNLEKDIKTNEMIEED